MDKQTCMNLIKGFFEKDPAFSVNFGFTFDDVECGVARCSMALQPNILDHEGRLCEGIFEVLADNAAGMACWSKGDKCLTQSLTCHVMCRRAAGTRIRAEGRLVQASGNARHVEVSLTLDDGTLLARVYLTMFRIDSFAGVPEKW